MYHELWEIYSAEELWSKLGDIPTDSDDKIEENFFHFDVGTHREEIWHWFEDTYDISIVDTFF